MISFARSMFSGLNSNLTLALLSEVSRCYFLEVEVECEKKGVWRRSGVGRSSVSEEEKEYTE